MNFPHRYTFADIQTRQRAQHVAMVEALADLRCQRELWQARTENKTLRELHARAAAAFAGLVLALACLAGCAAPVEREASTSAADSAPALTAREVACVAASPLPACPAPGPSFVTACAAAVVPDAQLRMVQLGDWSGVNMTLYRLQWTAIVDSGLLAGRLAEYGVHSVTIESWNDRSEQDAYVVPDVAPLQGAPDAPGLVYVFLLAPGQTTTTMQVQGSRGYHNSWEGRPYVFATYQDDPFVVPVHELSEALTDSTPGLGWSSSIGEIADVCQGESYDVVAGVNVASVWSEALCSCI